MRRLLVVLGILTSPTVAAAQPGLAPPSAAVEIEQPAFGTDADVLADRAFATPTALVQPEGSIGLTGIQIGPVTTLLATVGVADGVQVQGTYVRLVDGDDYLAGAMAKARVYRSGQLHIAIQGGFWRIPDDYDPLTVVHGEIAATACLDPACRSLVSGFAGTARAIGEDAQPLLLSGAAVLAITDHLKLVGELDRGFADGEDGDLVWVGVRVTGSRFGVDLGALAIPGDEAVAPTISLTYRGG